jgi:acetyl esterase/lipase
MAQTFTREELSAAGEPSPELLECLKTSPKPPTFDQYPDITVMRKKRFEHLEALRPQYPIEGAIPDIVVEKDVYVPYPALADAKIQVRVYSPKQVEEQARLPVVLLFHEGGFMVGDISDEEHSARLFASSFDSIVLNVEYLLAPEHKFPDGVLSCYHILEKLCSDPSTFHAQADPIKGVVVGGSSAGGNIAAVLCHHARQNKLSPPVTGQWLSVPIIMQDDIVPEKYKHMWHSRDSHVDPVLDAGEGGVIFKAMFAGIGIDTTDTPLVSALLRLSRQLSSTIPLPIADSPICGPRIDLWSPTVLVLIYSVISFRPSLQSCTP